jgi:hypothetical protein
MKPIISSIFCIIFFGIFNCPAQKILDERVNLKLNNTRLPEALKTIEQQSGARFAYNAQITEDCQSVSFQANNICVGDALNHILQNKYSYQTAGSHIILLPQKNTNQQTKKQVHTISGTIYDSKTGKGIKYASIYDVNERFSSVSDSKGRFSFQIKSKENLRGLNFSKTGYKDSILMFNTLNPDSIHISLTALPGYNLPIPEMQPGFRTQARADEIVAVKDIFLSEQVSANAENLQHIDEINNFQFSILPGLSSNFSKYGVLENRVSINLLAGYSKGVKGFEIGTLANISKQNVVGLQIAGLTNITGGNLHGSQISGLANIGSTNTEGTQISGGANFNKNKFEGLQIASIFNQNNGPFEGVQIAGLINKTYSLNGLQIAGLLNTAKSHTNGSQIAVGGNYSKSGISEGLQIAVLFNKAYHQKGLQIALVNINDTSEGFEAGLFSYVRRGFREQELAWDELNMLNYIFRTGNHKFYNILHSSVKPDKFGTLSFGYGLGRRVLEEKAFQASLEISYHMIISDNYGGITFYDYNKIGLYACMPFGKNLQLSLGPDINFHFTYEKDNPISKEINDNYLPGFSNELSSIRLGFRAGIRL